MYQNIVYFHASLLLKSYVLCHTGSYPNTKHILGVSDVIFLLSPSIMFVFVKQ